jgi:hypothetical protein
VFPLGFAPPQLRPWARTSKEPSSARERPPRRGLFLLPTAALDGPRRYRRRPRSSPMTLPDPTALFGTKIVCRNLGRSCKSASRQLAHKGSPPPSLRLLQAKLSRNSDQIARGRIRRFESYMPSQPVRSLWGCKSESYGGHVAIGGWGRHPGSGEETRCVNRLAPSRVAGLC